jgi:hypothetical protein
MGKLPFKLLLLAVALVAVFAAVALLRSGRQKPAPSMAAPVFELTPGPSMVVEVEAPNGKATLILREKRVVEGTKWLLSVKGEEGTEKEILTKILPSGSSLSIPYNTFSPDNKFVFLKETSPGGVSYLVLATSGAPLTKDTQGLEIVSLFTQKYPNFKITDVTGWGGPTLVVINTDNQDGTIGPSFWFDVGSRSFIRLTNRFN